MKILPLVCGLLILGGIAYAGDVEISFTIPSDNVEYCREGYLAKYSNSVTIADPKWVDPKDESVAPQIPLYTDLEWVRKTIKTRFIADVNRGHEILESVEIDKVYNAIKDNDPLSDVAISSINWGDIQYGINWSDME